MIKRDLTERRIDMNRITDCLAGVVAIKWVAIPSSAERI